MYNLFRKDTQKLLTGRIINKPTSTLCNLEDSKGRRFSAESDGSYIAGQTVLVKEGVVIGKTKKVRTVSHFNV